MSDIIRPIEPFQLTQGFGGNYEAYKKYGLKGHSGWDFKTKLDDTPKGFRYILASWLSKHYKTEDQGSKGFGKYFEVIIQLKNTWKLTYAHCKSIEAFTTKHEGEHMAISDSTGNSTGNHLHLTVKKGKLITGVFQHDNPNNGYFGAVNPQLFFDELRAFKKKEELDKPAPAASPQTEPTAITEPTPIPPSPPEHNEGGDSVSDTPSVVVSGEDVPVGDVDIPSDVDNTPDVSVPQADEKVHDILQTIKAFFGSIVRWFR